MKISTLLFGEVEIESDKIINFEVGIPAFPEENAFIILHDELQEDSVFCWLQSVKSPEITFTLVDIQRIMENYSPALDKETVLSLGQDGDIFTYNIATVPEDISEMTVNLKAPVVINAKTRKGMQIIAENDYPIRYKIFTEL